MKIGITGGKGGTGKTVIAVNLAIALAKNNRVTLIDCDVDCPNTYLIAGVKLENKEPITSFLPVIDHDKCIKCGKCVEKCETNALFTIKDKVNVMEMLCSGCETCKLVCPVDAISGTEKTIGYTHKMKNNGMNLIVGELIPSEPISAAVVGKALERGLLIKSDFHIIDTAAGTHCDVVEALYDVDFIFAVTEPTPFGEHDLNLILELLKKLGKNHKVIVNRSDITDMKIQDTFLEIPYDEKMIKCYAESTPIVVKYPEHKISKMFFELAKKLEEMK